MSSRVFKARTGHSPSNPQLCGLTQTPIQEGDYCFYLVCSGKSARPEYQISVVREEVVAGRNYKKKIRENPQGQTFFSVFTGAWETFTKPNGKTGKRRVYEWQTEDPKTGARIPVVVWSNMVLATSAEVLGYSVPMNAKGKYITTKAHQGDRTKGFEHKSAKEAEPAMVTIAKAALSDEEAGLVAPEAEATVEPEVAESEASVAQDAGPDTDEALAEMFGVTVEQYRRIKAANA
jgi:hypothetical protein